MTTPELPPLRPSTYGQATTKSEPQPRTYTAKSVEPRERILLARIAELEAQRDFLVDEYERAVKCGKQGYLHCAMHLFNAITNARIDAIITTREKKE